MVSLRLFFLTTSVFVSQGYSQLTAARPCGPATMTPTGPIIPVGQFIVPAVIKPLVAPCPPAPPCQPLPPWQPLPPCLPTPPSPPIQPCPPVKPAPCLEDDDDEDLDKILYQLINSILENRKNAGKKSGGGKCIDSDKSIDSSNNYADCGEDYEYMLPSLYAPYQTPASAALYPYGAGAGERAPAAGAGDAGFSIPVCGNGYAPEICLTFRPFTENCKE